MEEAEERFNAEESKAFQIGANQGQTASIALPNIITTELAKGAPNDGGFSSLADVDVTTSEGANAAMSMIDEAISQVTMIEVIWVLSRKTLWSQILPASEWRLKI